MYIFFNQYLLLWLLLASALGQMVYEAWGMWQSDEAGHEHEHEGWLHCTWSLWRGSMAQSMK